MFFPHVLHIHFHAQRQHVRTYHAPPHIFAFVEERRTLTFPRPYCGCASTSIDHEVHSSLKSKTKQLTRAFRVYATTHRSKICIANNVTIQLEASDRIDVKRQRVRQVSRNPESRPPQTHARCSRKRIYGSIYT